MLFEEATTPISKTFAMILIYLRSRSLEISRLLIEIESSVVVAVGGRTNEERAIELRSEGLHVEKLISAYDDYVRLHCC